MNEEFLQSVAEAIATSTFRYEMLKVSPEKIIVFDIDEATKLEGDTALYIQYAYTRCCGILRKAGKWKENFEVQKLSNEEKRLVKKLFEFPSVVERSVDELKPLYLCNYAHQLATVFNEFYNTCPVLNAKNEEVRNFRLTVTKATMVTMENAFRLLGIVRLKRM